MTTYAAEVTDRPGDVLRVIVAPSVQWAVDNLGGSWEETRDPYSAEEQVRAYAGNGQHFDPGVTEAFVGDEWSSDKATVPDSETGEYFYSSEGMLTWHNGKAWRNLSPTGTPNVYEPGVASWREYAMGAEFPLWIQPVGSVDAYPYAFTVEHEGQTWTSNVAANVWAPGTDNLWQLGTEPSVDPVVISQSMPTWAFYEVQSGDTLWSLSQSWGVTVEQVQEWNGIGDADVIFAGQTLRRMT